VVAAEPHPESVVVHDEERPHTRECSGARRVIVQTVSDQPTAGAPRRVRATRYVAPLREGGSLPGLVEADDEGMYVVKFRGAGQGPLVLVAEMIVGGLAAALAIPAPEVVLVEVPDDLGAAEPDQEIQDLLRASPGLNAGLDFLPGSLPFDPASATGVDPAAAADIVWLDALVQNVDRSARNPNLLRWHGRIRPIDHGAALYRHHGGFPTAPAARSPFPLVAEHVLLPFAGSIEEADERLAPRLDRAVLDAVVGSVPESWLTVGEAGPDERRRDYLEHLRERLRAPREFASEAERARRS
jgi:hypothetical protein